MDFFFLDFSLLIWWQLARTVQSRAEHSRRQQRNMWMMKWRTTKKKAVMKISLVSIWIMHINCLNKRYSTKDAQCEKRVPQRTIENFVWVTHCYPYRCPITHVRYSTSSHMYVVCNAEHTIHMQQQQQYKRQHECKWFAASVESMLVVMTSSEARRRSNLAHEFRTWTTMKCDEQQNIWKWKQ